MGILPTVKKYTSQQYVVLLLADSIPGAREVIRRESFFSNESLRFEGK